MIIIITPEAHNFTCGIAEALIQGRNTHRFPGSGSGHVTQQKAGTPSAIKLGCNKT